MADHGNTNPGNFANRPTEEVKEIASKGGQASGSDASEAVQDKGKGKALAESADTSMMEDDESSSDEEPVSIVATSPLAAYANTHAAARSRFVAISHGSEMKRAND